MDYLTAWLPTTQDRPRRARRDKDTCHRDTRATDHKRAVLHRRINHHTVLHCDIPWLVVVLHAFLHLLFHYSSIHSHVTALGPREQTCTRTPLGVTPMSPGVSRRISPFFPRPPERSPARLAAAGHLDSAWAWDPCSPRAKGRHRPKRRSRSWSAAPPEKELP